jgi:hypothetical protein
VAGSCEHGDETSGSVTAEEYVDQLSDYQRINKDYVHVRSECLMPHQFHSHTYPAFRVMELQEVPPTTVGQSLEGRPHSTFTEQKQLICLRLLH